MRLRLTRRRGKSNGGHALSCPMRVRVRARQLLQKCWPCASISSGRELDSPALCNMSSYQAWTLPSVDSLRISASRSLTLPYCLLLMDVPCPRTSRSATPQARNPSHYHALGAASRLGIVIADIHGLDGTVWCRGAAAGRVSLHFAVEASDFADDIVECLVDVDPRLC